VVRASRALGKRGTADSFTVASREIVWQSGTGRVIRQGDVVKIEGMRGRYTVAGRQPFLPDAVALHTAAYAAMRYVAPERVHLRRKATATRQSISAGTVPASTERERAMPTKQETKPTKVKVQYVCNGRVMPQGQNSLSSVAYQYTNGVKEGEPRISSADLRSLLATLGVEDPKVPGWKVTLPNAVKVEAKKLTGEAPAPPVKAEAPKKATAAKKQTPGQKARDRKADVTPIPKARARKARKSA
jgi:hypothetical protein